MFRLRAERRSSNLRRRLELHVRPEDVATPPELGKAGVWSYRLAARASLYSRAVSSAKEAGIKSRDVEDSDWRLPKPARSRDYGSSHTGLGHRRRLRDLTESLEVR